MINKIIKKYEKKMISKKTVQMTDKKSMITMFFYVAKNHVENSAPKFVTFSMFFYLLSVSIFSSKLFRFIFYR